MANYNNYSNDELIDLLRTGDRRAYTEIYNRYNRLLYLFAFKRLGNREEVKDIVHEIFLSLWLNHQSIILSHTLTTYLYSAVRNKIVDVIARKQLTERYIETFNLYKLSAPNTTDHQIRYNELSAIVEQEIGALPKKMRQVFNLSRKTNLSRKEIAGELNLSEQTVKSHMQHALKILRIKIGRLFFHE